MAISQAQTATPPWASIFTQNLTSTPTLGSADIDTNIDLQKAIKLTLELFIKDLEYDKANFIPRNGVFKAQNLNLYYESLHIEYYYFC